MADKQIIINGEYWRKKYGDMHIRLSNKVAELEQQLKHKDQECERWKSNFNGKVSAIEELLKQLDQLKAENDELKNKINSLICSENCYKYKQSEKLKQALTEIKELCEEKEDWCDYETGEPTDNAIFAKQILEKISEVFDDTSN